MACCKLVCGWCRRKESPWKGLNKVKFTRIDIQDVELFFDTVYLDKWEGKYVEGFNLGIEASDWLKYLDDLDNEILVPGDQKERFKSLLEPNSDPFMVIHGHYDLTELDSQYVVLFATRKGDKLNCGFSEFKLHLKSEEYFEDIDMFDYKRLFMRHRAWKRVEAFTGKSWIRYTKF